MSEPAPPNSRPASSTAAYLELVRLPNVFTAVADVMMGYLFVREFSAGREAGVLGLLVAASGLLYASGVVLNDVFDLRLDSRLRPERPLPSGRISPAAARRLGWTLMVLGGASACVAALLSGQPRPAMVAALLAGCIVLYDARLKGTQFGPPAMGTCRMLNVLLGMSVAAGPLRGEHLLVAGAIGTYVAGVTWFARTETRQSNRLQLAAGVAVMIVGIALLGWLPEWTDRLVPLLRQQPGRWYLLVAVLGAMIVWRCLWAVIEPIPLRVQQAVKHCILSLVFLDAAACYAVRDRYWAFAILLLLVPAIYFGRWIRST